MSWASHGGFEGIVMVAVALLRLDEDEDTLVRRDDGSCLVTHTSAPSVNRPFRRRAARRPPQSRELGV